MINMMMTEVNVGLSDPTPDDLVQLSFEDIKSGIRVSLMLGPEDRAALASRLSGRPAILVPKLGLAPTNGSQK